MAGILLILNILSLAMFVMTQRDDIRKPPTILYPRIPEQRVYQVNQRVVLNCSASGIPEPTYEWRWNNRPIITDKMKMNFDPFKGVLVIPQITLSEEGIFICYATTRFPGPGQQQAVAVSAELEVRVARIEDFQGTSKTFHALEGDSLKIPCDDKPLTYGHTTFKWYIIRNQENHEITKNARIFIDQKGTLHFAYVLKSDENLGSNSYRCGLSNTLGSVIKLGSLKWLSVQKFIPIPERKPFLSSITSGPSLTVLRNGVAKLECIFGGYTASQTLSETVPKITWFVNNFNHVVEGDRYAISDMGRTLTISNITEHDEKAYFCRGTNALGSFDGKIMLNVTSPPIFVHPLKAATVIEGQNAELKCVTRSAFGENPPETPLWYRNGKLIDSGYDPNKYQFNSNRTVLTIKQAIKSMDIACYQCSVTNSIGRVFDDSCLNVILPITVLVQPSLEQNIQKGDMVNLTVVAATDPLLSLTYQWLFQGRVYEMEDAPPYVSYDFVNKLAFINTSALTDEEYSSIRGTYRRKIFHEHETVFIDVIVNLDDFVPEPSPVALGGTDYWIIGLVIGILVILMMIILIFIICRQKTLEGTYQVDKKETAAGLDPEKELLNSGFHELSRAEDSSDYTDSTEKKPLGSIEFGDLAVGEDDESFSEYGEETTRFNEDGSFIGIYSPDVSNDQKPSPAYLIEESHV